MAKVVNIKNVDFDKGIIDIEVDNDFTDLLEIKFVDGVVDVKIPDISGFNWEVVRDKREVVVDFEKNIAEYDLRVKELLIRGMSGIKMFFVLCLLGNGKYGRIRIRRKV